MILVEVKSVTKQTDSSTFLSHSNIILSNYKVI